MAHIIGSPSRYVQGAGEIKNLAKNVAQLGSKLFILTSASGRGRVEGKIAEGLGESTAVYEVFNGECCMTEIDRVKAAFDASGCDLIVGIGGGKIHDTAKAAAYYAGVPVVIVPTIASTDAPCSALSVIYTEDGVFEKYLFLPANPNMVLVDTDIVAAAPVRLLVAGMGDALATYFEARATQRACANVNAGLPCGFREGFCPPAKTTMASQMMAELCYKTLLADGAKAKAACDCNVVTPALENIIETNILLSGLGFESGGLAAAHAVHDGLTALAGTHHNTHGEKVAFGTLVQLVLENAPTEEINEVLGFCKSVGLPMCLADIGVTEISAEELKAVAEKTCIPEESVHSMPFPVTPDMVAAAIVTADKIGAAFKEA